MMDEVLMKLESAVPSQLRESLRRRLNIGGPAFIDFSNNLKQLVQNHQELKEILFKNNEAALHFSGDVLAKTFHDYWIKGGNLNEIFIENAQAASFYGEFECLW
jgi:hypothetical protein